MRTFWRWLSKPVISIADSLLLVTVVCAADAVKLGWHLPWWLVIITGWGGFTAAFFLIGFAKGLCRHRAGRNRVGNGT